MAHSDKTNESNIETFLENFVFVFIILALTAAVLFDSYRFYNQESLLPSLFFLPVGLLFVFSLKNILSEISLLGFLSAKLKENVSLADKKILEMNEVLSRLKNLGISQIKMNLAFLGGQELIHEIPRDTRLTMRDKFVAFLKEFNASDSEMHEGQKYWIKAMSIAYCRSITKHLSDMGLNDISKRK